MIVLRLFGRKFCVTRKDSESYASFIVREVPKDIKEGDEFNVEGLLMENGDKEVKLTVSVVKVISNKMVAFKKKRRKRYKKSVGYRQKIAYFKISKIS